MENKKSTKAKTEKESAEAAAAAAAQQQFLGKLNDLLEMAKTSRSSAIVPLLTRRKNDISQRNNSWKTNIFQRNNLFVDLIISI